MTAALTGKAGVENTSGRKSGGNSEKIGKNWENRRLRQTRGGIKFKIKINTLFCNICISKNYYDENIEKVVMTHHFFPKSSDAPPFFPEK